MALCLQNFTTSTIAYEFYHNNENGENTGTSNFLYFSYTQIFTLQSKYNYYSQNLVPGAKGTRIKM